MPNILVQPFVLRDVLLQIGANNYETAVSAAVFTPNAAQQTWQGLTPASSFTDVATATWVAALTFAQDWDTPQSLSEYLFDNEGATVPASFRPKNGRGSSFSTSLVITPGAIGGPVNTFQEATVNLGCTGKPTRIPAAAAVPLLSASAPVTGAVAGATLVKITGKGFTGATAVHFGTVAATFFQVDSDSVIYAVAPAQAAGSKPIKVTNPTGQSTQTAPYTYA